MTPFAIALALFAQDPAPAPTPEEPPATASTAPAPAFEDRLPPGAPREDYPFVAWCYGALRGYIDLHDEMMPEVTRIERQFRKPGTTLEEDLKVYADMQRDGRAQLTQFQAALTAAEKASVRPINAIGANAVRQGRLIWNTGPNVSKAQKAQAWMSWTLPARCEAIATALETRSRLLGATLRANAEEVEARPSATDEASLASPTPAETETPVPDATTDAAAPSSDAAAELQSDAPAPGAEGDPSEAIPAPESPTEGGDPSAV
jgi:hypothetical protein